MGFFGGFLGETQIGFVAIEKAGENLYYMERLAVLPRHRHHGHGRTLVQFVEDHVRTDGGRVISIGIIYESPILKDWYRQMGFRETSKQKFSHLPFTVCFMEKEVAATRLRSGI